MKTSISVVCYNNLELVFDTVESVIKKTTGDWELLLIDNHSLDSRTRDYIKEIKNPSVRYIDAGGNIGCNNGYNLGFDNSDGDFLVKLDDDTVIQDTSWNEHLIRTITRVSENIQICSAVAPDCNVKHKHENEKFIIGDLVNGDTEFDMVKEGTLGFSCVLFPKEVYKEFGPFMSKKRGEKSLYGGGELYYATLAREKGYCFGYDMNTYVFHQANEYRDLDYLAWKVYYGHYNLTDLPLDEFKKDNNMLIDAWNRYKNRSPENQWIQEKSDERLKQLTQIN